MCLNLQMTSAPNNGWRAGDHTEVAADIGNTTSACWPFLQLPVLSTSPDIEDDSKKVINKPQVVMHWVLSQRWKRLFTLISLRTRRAITWCMIWGGRGSQRRVRSPHQPSQSCSAERRCSESNWVATGSCSCCSAERAVSSKYLPTSQFCSCIWRWLMLLGPGVPASSKNRLALEILLPLTIEREKPKTC